MLILRSVKHAQERCQNQIGLRMLFIAEDDLGSCLDCQIDLKNEDKENSYNRQVFVHYLHLETFEIGLRIIYTRVVTSTFLVMVHMTRFFVYSGRMSLQGSYQNPGCGTFVEGELLLGMYFHLGHRSRILQVLRYTVLERNQAFLDGEVMKLFQIF